MWSLPISPVASSDTAFVPLEVKGDSSIQQAIDGIGGGDAWWQAIIAALGTGVCSTEDMVDFGLDFGGMQAAAVLLNQLDEWHGRGLLSFVFHSRGSVVAECFGDFKNTPYVDLGHTFRVSQNAFVRPSAGRWGSVLQTAISSTKIVLHTRVLMRLLDDRFSTQFLTGTEAVSWLTESSPELTEDAAHGLLSLLVRAGAVEAEQEEKAAYTGALRMWEFHDLLFHTRSTRGREGYTRQGATFRFRGLVEPAPARRGASWPMCRTLAHAEPSDLQLPLWDAIHQRRSPPDGLTVAKQVNLDDLGRFLSTLAILPDGKGAGMYETTRRLYPGAGACYELEFYPVVANCEGVSRGTYYYDPELHGLCHVSEWDSRAELIVRRACEATGRIESPACIVLISARFARLAWKYEGIAYALCLKNVGVVFEHMYLVGAALGLEVCALGSADADLFHNVTGNDPFVEPLVAQFMIVGRRNSYVGSVEKEVRR
jgi:oxazoline/thiazoline dehydrogenase